MPAVNTGRANVGAAGKSAGKKKVRRAKAKPVAGPPAPKRVTVVAPADRVSDRVEARKKQLVRSVPKTPDQADRKRAPAQKQRDATVVADNIKVARKKVKRDKIAAAIAEGMKNPKVSSANAPALKVLAQTTRPLHAIASAAKEDVRTVKKEGLGHYLAHGTSGRGLKAAGRGIQNKDKTTFSDVFTEAGWKPKGGLGKFAKGTASLGADIVLDPTTYVTGGSGSVAAKTAEKAAAKATRKATKAGLSGEQAAKMGDRARVQAEAKGDQTRGITVKLAGKELPGVRAATANVSKPVRAAGRKVVPERARDNVRAAGADVNPDVAPAGVSRETSRKAVQATRTARAKSDRGLHEAQQQAIGIKRSVGEENYSRVIDAIENGTIGKLPPELRDVAVRVRSQFRYANRQRKHAGIRGGEIKKRGKVQVPGVTADTSLSAKAVGKARRAEATAKRALSSAESRHSVYQGRAEVLSRSVNGARAEKAAERGRDKQKSRKVAAVVARTERRALAKGLTPMQAASAANRVAAAMRAPRYAAGGKGVRDTAVEVRAAERRLADAAIAREVAEKTHAGTVSNAAGQRAARDVAEKTNAIRAAAPKEYIPHHLTDEAVEAEEKAARGGTGRKVIRPTSSKARSDNRPLSELREEMPGRYSEDLPNLYASRKAEGATSVARAELNRRIADLGTTVRKGRDITLERGESVYHILGSDIRKVPSKEAAEVAEKGGKNGRYVVLNDDVVKRAVEGAQPTLEGPGLVRGYDKIQSGFKRVALATPGFHVRNLVGDTQNAYLGQAGHRIPRNMVQAGRVLKAEGRKDKSLRALGQGKAGTGTVKTGRYGEVTYDEVAEQLTKHGAMRTGYTARELPELSGKTARAGRVRAPRRVKQALLNREDLPRVTTALGALKKGATWEQAAQRVADYHFDYGHLTRFERNVGRRVAPFYTFTARNVPLQVKTLVTKPGKFANYEKIREEAAKLAGMDEESQKARGMTDKLKQAGVKLPKGWEANLSEWEQRNVGVPVKWKGKTFTVSMGLPLADLNEVPGAALGDQINEYYQKGMSLAGPLPKNVIEYMENHSFFFRDDIERPNAPLVAAPAWVRGLPAGLKKQMGVTENYVDKKTGKKALAYRAKADYVIKSIPGTPAFLNKLATDGHDRVGKGPAGKTLAFAGVKATPFDPVSNAVNLAYDRLEEIDKQKSVLNQQGVNAKHPTKGYVKLLQQEKLLNSLAFQGRREQGYKVLPATGGPPKNRSGAGRVRLPGVSGRVKVPGSSSGRVKVP